MCQRNRELYENHHLCSSKSPFFYQLEPVCGGGRFWSGSAGHGREKWQKNVLCGPARETVWAPQAWPEEALHCCGKPLLDGPWDAVRSVSLYHLTLKNAAVKILFQISKCGF